MKLGEQFRSEVVAVPPDVPIRAAAWRMKDQNIGAVVVVEDHKVVGIVTDRDLALKLGLDEATPETPIEKIMSKPVLTIWDDQGVFNATQYLMGHHVRRLPIIDRENNLVGMVTLDDIFALLADEMRNLGRAVCLFLQQRKTTEIGRVLRMRLVH